MEGNLREPPYTMCKRTEKAVAVGATRDNDGAYQAATSANLGRRTTMETATGKVGHSCEDLDQGMIEAEAPTERWRHAAEGLESPPGTEIERLNTEPSGDCRSPIRGKKVVQEVGKRASNTAVG